MTAEQILLWHDFFVTIAQVGATLAGLLFVGLTISLSHLIGTEGYLTRAFTALFLLFELTLIGILGLVPGQSPAMLGLELVVTGLAVFTGITLFWKNFPENRNAVLGGRGPKTVRYVLAIAGTLLPALSGLLLMLGWPGALNFLVPAVMSGLYLSIANAWVFAVEVPRRLSQPEK
jgi:hypothetical protein